jgi:hypothetical protein
MGLETCAENQTILPAKVVRRASGPDSREGLEQRSVLPRLRRAIVKQLRN